MAQRVGGGGADVLVGKGLQGVGIGEADVGRHAAAHDGHLAALFGVGDDGELGDVGAGAAGGGTEHHGRQRPDDPVRSLEVADPAAVGNQDGDPLGRVHGAPAAEPDDDVRPLAQVLTRPLFDLDVLRDWGRSGRSRRTKPASSRLFMTWSTHPALKSPWSLTRNTLCPPRRRAQEPTWFEHPAAEDDLGDLELAMAASKFVYFHPFFL